MFAETTCRATSCQSSELSFEGASNWSNAMPDSAEDPEWQSMQYYLTKLVTVASSASALASFRLHSTSKQASNLRKDKEILRVGGKGWGPILWQQGSSILSSRC